MLGLALNLSKLTTRKGAKIEVHFENISNKTLLEQQYSHSKFLKRVNRDVDQWGKDNGRDTVHLLINNQGLATLMAEIDYAKWQATPEKDWFHEEEIQVIVLSGFLEDFTMEDLFLHSLKNGPRFVGMPKKEYDEFFADRNNLKNLEAVRKAYPECCRFCPVPMCFGREVDFDRLAYERAITGLQITTTNEE